MVDAATIGISSVEGDDKLARAKALLESGEVGKAVSLLESLADRTDAASALLGVAYFRLEEYSKAAEELAKIATRPAYQRLGKLLELARANDHTDVRRSVPAKSRFDRETLLSGPKPGENGEERSDDAPPQSAGSRLLALVGNWGGVEFGETLGALTELFGREKAKSLWSTWYTHGPVRALLMLARRRERLNRTQLFSAYPAGAKTGFHEPNDAAPSWVAYARTADGSYNDLDDPMAGASGTRFGFNTDPVRTIAETGVRLLTPNPRTVSRVLFTRKDGFKAVPFLNLNAASWIQFMNHDWVSYGEPADAEPYRIPLAEDDPVRRTLHQKYMLVRPTQTDPTRQPGETTPSHINEVTSWWDGSQIYGSNEETVQALRSHHGGKLRLDPKTGNLPVLPDGVEHAGFRRNWWVGLSMLHVLFVKEHNAICDRLAASYPHFSDQRLYDTARLINAAVLAKIHTVEWTPGILPNPTLYQAMNANWYGELTNVLRAKKARRTLATINIADPVAGGIVGNATDNHGVSYSLTREFLSVYRLHSLLPDRIALHRIGSDAVEKTYGLAELRQAGAHKITDTVPISDLFYSFGIQHPGQLVLNNYPETLQNLSIPGAGFYDLGAVDVLRDRERGTPRYNQFRRLLGLEPIARFADLTADTDAVRALMQVYDDVEDIDLLVGNLAEAHRPTGFGFGETLFEVFILNASRRLQADRFFTDWYREEVYTAEGLDWIDDASFKTVLLRHYPELARTGLANVENAFEPWDIGSLDPERHPLRQFDPELSERDERARVS
jgi:hypothetical protein